MIQIFSLDFLFVSFNITFKLFTRDVAICSVLLFFNMVENYENASDIARVFIFADEIRLKSRNRNIHREGPAFVATDDSRIVVVGCRAVFARHGNKTFSPRERVMVVVRW